MNYLAEILKTNTVSSLINSKPIQRDKFIFLGEEDTVRTALISFIKYKVISIPLKGHKEKFLGLIGISKIVKFIFSHHDSVETSAILDIKLKTLPSDYILEIEYVDFDMTLMDLLIDIWTMSCNPKITYRDCNHLLTSGNVGNYDIITPIDFLRYLLLINQDQTTFLNDTSALEIENAFDIEKGFLINWEDDARVAMEHVIQSDPFYLVAVINEETGGLEANITFADIIPADESLLEESFSILLNNGISLQSYIKTIHSSTSKSSIDPIILHPNFTINDLIEKLIRHKIDYLWRVTPDAVQKPLGAVGVIDVLRYLSFMFRPFHQEKEKAG